MGVLSVDFSVNMAYLIAAIFVVVVAYYKWSFQYWKKRNVPYLEPSIPLGNFCNPYRRELSVGDEIAALYKQIRAKGYKYCGIYAMVRPLLFVTDLDMLKSVMTKDFNYFVDRGFYHNEKVDPMSCHLFAIGGTKWKNLRAKLTPTFTTGKMKGMFQIVVDSGLTLEKHMEEEVVNTEPIDIKDILGRFTTDVIGSCAFGLECNSFKDPNCPFRVYGKANFELDRMSSLKRTFAHNFQDTARALGVRLIKKDVSDFYTKVVHDTVRYREKNNYVRKDFLQMLIDLKNDNNYKVDGKPLTMDEITAQCFVFFLAGFETSSTTMTYALYELVRQPDIQEKVREEIYTVLKKHENQVTYDSLSELNYMSQVINETLRKYPPVPVLTRRCVKDYKVPGEDVIIEEGTNVNISVLGIHYDEEYYKNPTEFDPERFNEENTKKRHQYAHIPFGEGPRICIGMRFGIMQVKVGLTCLLRKFRFTLNEKTQVPLKFSIKSPLTSSEGGIWLNVERI